MKCNLKKIYASSLGYKGNSLANISEKHLAYSLTNKFKLYFTQRSCKTKTIILYR